MLGVGEVEIVSAQVVSKSVVLAIPLTEEIRYPVVYLLCSEVLVDLRIIPYQLWVGLNEAELV